MSQDHLQRDKKTDAGLPGPGSGVPPMMTAMLASLETAANKGDCSGFAVLLTELNWEALSADDLIRIIRLALKAGAHLEARQLSARTLQKYPDDPTVKKIARMLSAPRVISSSLPPAPDVEANRAWLKVHNGEYAGRWVALRAGELLAVGASPKELAMVIGNTSGVLLTLAR